MSASLCKRTTNRPSGVAGENTKTSFRRLRYREANDFTALRVIRRKYEKQVAMAKTSFHQPLIAKSLISQRYALSGENTKTDFRYGEN
jgi:hypothetical protein